MVLTREHFTGKWFTGTSSAVVMIVALLLVSGCGTSRTSAVDRQYQRIVEQQQFKNEVDDTDLEAKLPPANDPEAFERMGDTYLKTGNPGMAFLEYSKALKADPNRVRTRQKLAYLMLKRGMSAGAISEFDAILKKSPGDTGALQGKATALMQLNRLEDAEKVLNTAIDNDTGLWQAHALLGMVYDRQKLHGPAIEAYEKAIAINPKATAVYNNLGTSFYMTGRYQESARALLKAISLKAAGSETYNKLGLALFKMGLAPEAYEAFRKAGDEANACNNMGILYMETKDYARSVEFFEKAIDLKPTYYENAHAGLKKARAALQQEKPDRITYESRSQ